MQKNAVRSALVFENRATRAPFSCRNESYLHKRVLNDHDLVAPEPVPTMLTDPDVLAAFEKVPEDFRKLLLLVDVEEFSYKEASSVLRIR